MQNNNLKMAKTKENYKKRGREMIDIIKIKKVASLKENHLFNQQVLIS